MALQMLGSVALSVALSAAAAESFPVPVALWDRPRSGQIVLELAAVKQAVDAYLAAPDVRLIIHHPPGQASLLEAEELRAWLVALSISPDRVGLKNDLARGDALTLEVVR